MRLEALRVDLLTLLRSFGIKQCVWKWQICQNDETKFTDVSIGPVGSWKFLKLLSYLVVFQYMNFSATHVIQQIGYQFGWLWRRYFKTTDCLNDFGSLERKTY